MRRVLITGANSYVGTNVERWLMKESDKFHIETLDMKDPNWKEFDFRGFDVVFHVAGLVHTKETLENANSFRQINTILAYDVAKKSKIDGVKQFIFLSSMSVYGIDEGIINFYTSAKPKSIYGKSKLDAEILLIQLQDNNFFIAIIRAPMIYGNKCKGNYQRLASVAKKVPVFPKVNSLRSMIFIDNLSQFIKQLINYECKGLFFPQNNKYVNVSDLVVLIAKQHGKKILVTSLLNPIVFIGMKFSTIFRKVFGSLIYDRDIDGDQITVFDNGKFDYETCSFKESISKTEN